MSDIRVNTGSGWKDARGSPNSGGLIVADRILFSTDAKALASAGDYAAEDVLSESATAGTAWRFKNVVLQPGGSGLITSFVALLATTALTPELVIDLYKSTPTCNLNDNGANTGVLAADVPIYIDSIYLVALSDIGGHSKAKATLSTVGGLPIPFTCLGDSVDIYAVTSTADAITGEAAGNKLTLTMGVKQY